MLFMFRKQERWSYRQDYFSKRNKIGFYIDDMCDRIYRHIKTCADP